MTEVSDKSLPKNIEAETAVLSAMMIDSTALSRGTELLQEQHFYKSTHRIIFRCMVELFMKSIEVDIITLIHKLEEKGELEKVGGTPYINELSDVVLSYSNLDYHAMIVLEKALLRDLITTANHIIKTCYESEGTARDIIEEAERSIFQIAEVPNHKSLTRVSQMIGDTIKTIEEVSNNKSSLIGIPSGFRALDSSIGGFRKGQFIVVAARPSMGKTSFALNIAFHAAMNYNKKVAIFTLEMASEELIMRLLSSHAEIGMDTLLKGSNMDERKMLGITQVAEQLLEKDIYIDDTGSSTVMDIRSKTRRLKAELKGLDLLIIDYIQLMTTKRRNENRQQDISDISRELKSLAKELDLPVIALSQLNRSLEKREDKRPLLSDLRESGAIEQDADIVMFIYRDDYYLKEKSKKQGIAEIIIGKNRHGPTGDVDLLFRREITRFEDLQGNEELKVW